MEVTINIPDNVADAARASGVPVEQYVQEILARQAGQTVAEGTVSSINAAIDKILELRQDNNLAGLRTKDLIHEGHRY